MSNVPFFPNTEISLSTYNGYDDDGDPCYEVRETVPADIQPLSPAPSMQIFGEILQDTYRVYLSSDTVVYANDLVVIGDVKYSIVGSVEDWNHLLPFKKITIRKERKSVGGKTYA